MKREIFSDRDAQKADFCPQRHAKMNTTAVVSTLCILFLLFGFLKKIKEKKGNMGPKISVSEKCLKFKFGSLIDASGSQGVFLFSLIQMLFHSRATVLSVF